MCFLCTPPISSRSHYVVTGQWRCGDLQNHVPVTPWFLHSDCVLFRSIARDCRVRCTSKSTRDTHFCVYFSMQKNTQNCVNPHSGFTYYHLHFCMWEYTHPSVLSLLEKIFPHAEIHMWKYMICKWQFYTLLLTYYLTCMEMH